jgi:hypothetical protein
LVVHARSSWYCGSGSLIVIVAFAMPSGAERENGFRSVVQPAGELDRALLGGGEGELGGLAQ